MATRDQDFSYGEIVHLISVFENSDPSNQLKRKKVVQKIKSNIDIVNAMSREEHGPWSVWAEKAQNICANMEDIAIRQRTKKINIFIIACIAIILFLICKFASWKIILFSFVLILGYPLSGFALNRFCNLFYCVEPYVHREKYKRLPWIEDRNIFFWPIPPTKKPN